MVERRAASPAPPTRRPKLQSDLAAACSSSASAPPLCSQWSRNRKRSAVSVCLIFGCRKCVAAVQLPDSFSWNKGRNKTDPSACIKHNSAARSISLKIEAPKIPACRQIVWGFFWSYLSEAQPTQQFQDASVLLKRVERLLTSARPAFKTECRYWWKKKNRGAREDRATSAELHFIPEYSWPQKCKNIEISWRK